MIRAIKGVVSVKAVMKIPMAVVVDMIVAMRMVMIGEKVWPIRVIRAPGVPVVIIPPVAVRIIGIRRIVRVIRVVLTPTGVIIGVHRGVRSRLIIWRDSGTRHYRA